MTGIRWIVASTLGGFRSSITSRDRIATAFGLQEFASDSTVRVFSWAVLAGHGVVLAFLVDTHALSALLSTTEPWCWPYFENCWRFRLPSLRWVPVIHLILMLMIGGAAFSLFERRFRSFWLFLLGLNGCMFVIMSMDYRFRLNELYMLFWLNLAFLFFQAKRWVVPLALVSFYFWAGLLKLNYEWLSGAVLYNDLWVIPSVLVPAACAYVVLLEVVFSWGLLASRGAIVASILVQFALFHVESLSQIHWFYPALMGTMLSWFVIDRRLGGPGTRARIGLLLRGKAPFPAYVFLAVFGGFQVLPHLYGGDPALTGQGRFFALHMFQARQVCEVTVTIRRPDGSKETRDLKLIGLAPRSVCDPVIYYNRVQTICRREHLEERMADLNFRMRIRRSTEDKFRTVVDAEDFCRTVQNYSVWSNNAWLR